MAALWSSAVEPERQEGSSEDVATTSAAMRWKKLKSARELLVLAEADAVGGVKKTDEPVPDITANGDLKETDDSDDNGDIFEDVEVGTNQESKKDKRSSSPGKKKGAKYRKAKHQVVTQYRDFESWFGSRWASKRRFTIYTVTLHDHYYLCGGIALLRFWKSTLRHYCRM